MPLEFRAVGGATLTRTGRGLVARGVAIRYGTTSQPFRFRDKGRIVERIAAGAAGPIDHLDVAVNREHRAFERIGSTGEGTVRLTDSPTDLRYEVDLDASFWGRAAAEDLRTGWIKGASLGFKALEEAWDGFLGTPRRTVFSLVLDHIALTARPLYSTTASLDGDAQPAVRSDAPLLAGPVRRLPWWAW